MGDFLIMLLMALIVFIAGRVTAAVPIGKALSHLASQAGLPLERWTEHVLLGLGLLAVFTAAAVLVPRRQP